MPLLVLTCGFSWKIERHIHRERWRAKIVEGKETVSREISMVWMRNKPRMTSEFSNGVRWIKIVTSDNRETTRDKERIRIAGLELMLTSLEKWLKSGSAKKDGEKDLWNLTCFTSKEKSEKEHSPVRPWVFRRRDWQLFQGRCLSQRWKSRRRLKKNLSFPPFPPKPFIFWL